jgi:hypothetical protein
MKRRPSANVSMLKLLGRSGFSSEGSLRSASTHLRSSGPQVRVLPGAISNCGLIDRIQGRERSMSGLEFGEDFRITITSVAGQLLTTRVGGSGDARALISVMVQPTPGEMDERNDDDEHSHPDEYIHAPRPRGLSPKREARGNA